MKIWKYTIIGERCSGTTYLENLMDINFEVDLTWKFGRKHFFGFHDDLLKDSDNTLFICIVRDICTWMNSLFRDKHHLPIKYIPGQDTNQQIDQFLNREWWSIHDDKHDKSYKEIKEDRNIYTGKRYKNIFELRYTKLKYMVEDLPKKTKNIIFIKYENLIDNFEETMKKIQSKNLNIRKNINFPVNTSQYKHRKNKYYTEVKKGKIDHIPNDLILNNPNFTKEHKDYEKKFYIYNYGEGVGNDCDNVPLTPLNSQL